MKNFFLAFLGFACIPALFLCCSKKKKLQQPNQLLAKRLVIDSLVCVDLSENLRGFSSGDDEILLMTSVRNKERFKVGTNVGYVRFHKEYLNHNIGQDISISEIKSKSHFTIILLEQDSKLTSHQLSSIVDSSKAFIAYPKVDKTLLQNELGDDDLLAVKVIHLKDIEIQKSKKTKLSGIHLFDEYEYWLYWHLE